jgi:hypothetical protein
MVPPPPDQQSIRDAIASEESRLLRLEEELTEARIRLASLKTALAVQPESIATSSSAPSTAAEKVALFRSRFRGREDIYPRFWTNTRTGRKGYAPACGNEWRIYDYVDREVPMLAQMFQKRLRGYRAIGYARGPVPARRREVDAQPFESFDAPAVAE